MDEGTTVTRDGEVAILRLDRPPVNALELGIATELGRRLAEIEESDAGAIVLTGNGVCFSAGLDLKVVPRYTPEDQRAMIAAANRLLARLYGCPRPVVAAINGHAIAGGFVIALACDYRVAVASGCKLGLTEARAGIPFPAVAMTILRAELAPAAARRLTLYARNVDPPTALECGAVDELRPAARVLERAVEVARDMAAIPRDTYARIKRQLRADVMVRLEEIVDCGADPLLAAWLGSETGDAAAAVLRGEGGT
jgi:enoyl-CoA hydratase